MAAATIKLPANVSSTGLNNPASVVDAVRVPLRVCFTGVSFNDGQMYLSHCDDSQSQGKLDSIYCRFHRERSA
jgi:hypothetical protein